MSPTTSSTLAPRLVIVCGPPGGYGKTTLAHELARIVGCPAICRDEMKEGMVHNNPGFRPGPGDPLTQLATPLFFEVLGILVRAGTTVVAEAAFQDKLWQPGLQPLTDVADLRIIRCTTTSDTAHSRSIRRFEKNPRTQIRPHRPRSAPDRRHVRRNLAAGAQAAGRHHRRLSPGTRRHCDLHQPTRSETQG